MSVQVRWYKVAQLELEHAVEWGKEKFGEQTAAKFFYSIIKFERLLSENPFMGVHVPEFDTPRRQYRSLVVHNNYKLVYYVDVEKGILYVVSLWDVRQNPVKLKKRIK